MKEKIFGGKVMKNKRILIIIFLIFVFFVTLFITGIIYKHTNIAVKTYANNNQTALVEKNPKNIVNEAAEIDLENKEYKKLLKDQKQLEVAAKQAKDAKDAEEAKKKLAIVAPVAVVTTKTNPIYAQDGTKVAYLTFDDGPSSSVTPRILDTLKQYNIKATFFVIGSMAEKNTSLVKREKAEGNVVANHTYSHNYDYIYGNTKNLIDDFTKCETLLKSILTDYNSKLVRFPGGSSGSKREAFRQAAVNAGYHYVDWNALNNDSEASYIPKGASCAPVETLLNSIKETCSGKQHVVILMHDAPAKTTTADCLPQVIEYLKSQGYIFKTLD